MKVYLDNAATTPLDKEVLDAMMPYLTEHFGNPSSSHSFGRKSKTAVEQARRTIAKLVNCTPSEIYFTSGGTEADNLAMHIAVNDLNCKHIITSPLEHNAVIRTAQKYASTGKGALSFVNLDEKGNVDLDHLESLLAFHPGSYVTLMHGNNEIGNLLPLREVGELCKKYNAIFHSDTVQTMGHYRFDLSSLHVHFINASSHKFHGPKGAGFIYVNRSVKGNASITGGGQERGLRGGTENIYGIVGLATALEICYRSLDEHEKHIRGIKQYMVSRLESQVPGIRFNGESSNNESLYTVLNVTLPESPNSDMILFLLDIEGIACSGGSACSSGAAKGSHVLEAIGALSHNCASLRFSFSRKTTKKEIDCAVECIRQLCLASVPA